MTLPAGTVTMLFTDIESSTALLTRLGDAWPAALERHRTLLRDAVTGAGGAVVDCQGDALFAAFRSARSGVAAAVSAQRALSDEPWPGGERLRVRMALHTGEPHRTDGGYTGIDVVRGARLCCAGHGGQVLLTDIVRLLAGVETRDLGSVRLRDIEEPERVHQLVAEGLPDGFPALREQAAQAAGDWNEREESGLDARIRRATDDLERRITEDVAASVERTLGAIRPPRTPGH